MAKFQPGLSGNPKGRTPSALTVANFRKRIAEHADGILQAVIQAAKGGDMVAARILLNRICPAMKPISPPLPELGPSTFKEQVNEIASLIIAGEISPDDAMSLFKVLLHMRKVAIETRFEFEGDLKRWPPFSQKSIRYEKTDTTGP
ncbi:MAG: DUF5681 domain-containing protein [Methylococcales bacterium]